MASEEEKTQEQRKAEDLKTAGNNLLQLGQVDKAIEKYTEALEFDSQNEKILCNRSAAYAAIGKWKNAAKDGKKAVKINNKSTKAYLRYGTASKQLEDYKEALKAFQDMSKLLDKNDPMKETVTQEIAELKPLVDEILKKEKEEEKLRREEEKRAAKAAKAKKKAEVSPEPTDTKEEEEELELVTKKTEVAGGKPQAEEEDSSGSLSEPEPNSDADVAGPPCCSSEWWENVMHVGNVANLCALVILIVGVLMKVLDLGPVRVQLFVYNCGMFAFSGGATNWIAIKMLFDKIPGLVGSGVIPSNFIKIRGVVKDMIMKNFFDETYLNYYLKKKILGMDIEKMLDDLIKKHNIADMVVEMAIEDPFMQDMAKKQVKPVVERMAERLAPVITQAINDLDFASGMKSAQTEMEKMLDKKLETLTPNAVKKLLEDIIRRHLYWLVVWGVVFGGLIGIISAALDLP